MSLSKRLNPLLSTGSTQENRPDMTKNVDWDLKNQIKQSKELNLFFYHFQVSQDVSRVPQTI